MNQCIRIRGAPIIGQQLVSADYRPVCR